MATAQEFDDFGLPIRKFPSNEAPKSEGDAAVTTAADSSDKGNVEASADDARAPAAGQSRDLTMNPAKEEPQDGGNIRPNGGLEAPQKKDKSSAENSDGDDLQDGQKTPVPKTAVNGQSAPSAPAAAAGDRSKTPVPPESKPADPESTKLNGDKHSEETTEENTKEHQDKTPDEIEYGEIPKPAGSNRQRSGTSSSTQAISGPSIKEIEASKKAEAGKEVASEAAKAPRVDHSRDTSVSSMGEFSHQQLSTHKDEEQDNGDGGWQTMPAYAPYDIYDDDNRLIAKEHNDEDDETYGYAGLGGAGKGYTRVLDDEDAESETSMDGNTKYLFKELGSTSMVEDANEQRDAVSQLQATKDLLTEGQRIAYVGVTRLELAEMQKQAEFAYTKRTKKYVQTAAEATRMWSQKVMIRLYAHMDISPAEQVMIEQLAAHGVKPADLTPVLMANARVKNPMANDNSSTPATPSLASPRTTSPRTLGTDSPRPEVPAAAPPPYEAHAHDGEDMPEVKTPSQLPSTQKIDIDLRWTVLCDLFLVLIADSIYDSRSRVLLERVGNALEVEWMDICRFEKRVTDALEMQQAAEKENWNEEEHLENRRKLALKKRYMMMGLATVGGGLVIGLSAGLLAPLIGAGLAAGFTTIGVGGTSSFLAGAGGAAIITTGATASGSFMGAKAANRRTGAVKTFEYRPLHNNKRVNLIVTVSGWMTSKVDDVRLPFSTVDPVMGDIYSILWEPEMLTSMGDTINILATEVSRRSFVPAVSVSSFVF
jgi:hypothetical protein